MKTLNLNNTLDKMNLIDIEHSMQKEKNIHSSQVHMEHFQGRSHVRSQTAFHKSKKNFLQLSWYKTLSQSTRKKEKEPQKCGD